MVSALYRQAGLEINGPELPDHAAIELEFLAFLAEQEIVDSEHEREWWKIRQLFIRRHAGRWLPDLGRKLSRSTDPAWAAVGQLLKAILSPPRRREQIQAQPGLPRIASAEACSLCGFCAQVCPTRALYIDEDSQTTRLLLATGFCVRCRKCERVCEAQTLKLDSNLEHRPAMILLRQSPRAICPGCGTVTFSQAELAAVATRLGQHPAWLDYCLECRAMAI
jgi:ferredoxin